MYRLLIVDDEVLVRIGIKNCIKWKEIGFEEPLEASNGREALSIIKSVRIDVVLTDIKMPEMDGMEMIKMTGKEADRPEIIILSCYNEFEYMREAMGYGVLDFLFKPKMYPDDIIKALKKAIERIEERKSLIRKLETLQKKVNSDSSQIKENFLLELIEGKRITNEEFFAKTMELDIHLSVRKLIAILFRVNNFNEVSRDRFNREQYRLKSTIRNLINENVGFAKKCEIVVKNLSEYILLCSRFDEASECKIYSESQDCGKKIIKLLKETLGLSVSGGISKIYNDPGSIFNAYSDAVFAADKSVIKGDGVIVLFDERDGMPAIKQSEMLDILNDVFSLGGYEYVEHIKSIFLKIRNSTSITIDHVKEISVNIVNQLFKNYINHPQLLCEIYKRFPQTYLSIYKINSITAVENYILELAWQLEQMTDKQLRNDVLKAAEYIKVNMSDPDLSLEKVAGQVNISKNYFSRLFKETMGESFTDYLIRIRLEHARELYLTSEMKVYEIAERVGYPNWRYFTKLYKKQMGGHLTGMRKLGRM